jgi:DNA replication protein DnaC
MLNHPTLAKLDTIGLEGFAQGLREQLESNQYRDLSFEERLGLLIDRELTLRDTKGLERRLKAARLRINATVEDIDFKHPRRLDSSLVRSLASGTWVRDKRNLLITGPTGVGKTYIACAMGHAACRQGFTALYAQTSRLLHELLVQKGDGRYLVTLKRLSKVGVLILDEWGFETPNADQRRILLELLDDRYERTSTIIVSQFPTELWYEHLAEDPTLADAILDRVLHNGYKLELQGESLRKKKRALTTAALEAA